VPMRASLRAIAPVWLALCLAIAAIGGFAYEAGRRTLRQTITNDLQAVAELKSRQLQQWIERRQDEALIIASYHFSSHLQQVLAQPGNPMATEALRYHLAFANTPSQRKQYRLRASDDGRLLLPPQDSPTSLENHDRASARQLAVAAAQSNRLQIEDLHFADDDPSRPVVIGFLIPIHAPADDADPQAKPLAVLQITLAADDVLFPLLLAWPGQQTSVEILLARPEGQILRYLAPLRQQPQTALRLTRPITPEQPLIASRVLHQGNGFYETLDYRGVDTLSWGLAVPGTPWLLIAKIDTLDAYRQFHFISALSALMLSGLLLLIGVWMLARQRHETMVLALYQEADDLFQNAPCGYDALDAEGRIILINDTLLQMLGYSRDELLGQPITRLFPEHLRPGFAARFTQMKTLGHVADHETELLCRDGRTLHVMVRVKVNRDAQGRFISSRAMLIDLSERRRLETKLRASHEQLKQLNHHHALSEEALRQRIARELHDELGQLLSLLNMKLAMLQMQFDETPGLFDQLEEMNPLVQRMVQVVRNVVGNLRPTALDLGIVGALEWLAETHAQITGINCRYQGLSTAPMLDDETATALFRIAQEALTNATRHGAPQHIELHLEQLDHTLRLCITDDGCGFDSQAQATLARQAGATLHFGLLGMQERTLAIGGTLTIDSAPGQGTRITIDLPCQKKR
jgi:PAS domain S-box-containing protein